VISRVTVAISVTVINAPPFPHAYVVPDTVSATWRIVHGKRIPQVDHIDEINFYYGNIDAINAEEGYENREC